MFAITENPFTKITGYCGQKSFTSCFSFFALVITIITFIQQVIINKQLEAEDNKKAEKIDDDDVANAKKIQEK